MRLLLANRTVSLDTILIESRKRGKGIWAKGVHRQSEMPDLQMILLWQVSHLRPANAYCLLPDGRLQSFYAGGDRNLIISI